MKTPIAKIKCKAVLVSVWENNNDQLKTWETIQLEKLFKGQDGKWNTTNNFNLEKDLDNLITALETLRNQIKVEVITPYPKQ